MQSSSINERRGEKREGSERGLANQRGGGCGSMEDRWLQSGGGALFDLDAEAEVSQHDHRGDWRLRMALGALDHLHEPRHGDLDQH
eukprot:148918-Prymnesium_polylepis.1